MPPRQIRFARSIAGVGWGVRVVVSTVVVVGARVGVSVGVGSSVGVGVGGGEAASVGGGSVSSPPAHPAVAPTDPARAAR
jgi:hypothetical protein